MTKNSGHKTLDPNSEVGEKGDTRNYHKKYMSVKRAKEQTIDIDLSRKNRRRIKNGKTNPEYFLRTYFPEIFYNPFSDDQQYLIDQMAHHIKRGGRKAIAAQRGGGKTSIGIGMTAWGIVHGFIRYAIWAEANFDSAKDSLDNIKSLFEDKYGGDKFRDDFPEMCDPIRKLDGAAQRARMQKYNGERTKLYWGADKIILPTIKDVPGSGVVVHALGAEKAIRGKLHKGTRPDFVMINDIETEETAKSLVMTETIRKFMEKSVPGLAGQGRKICIIMLCTIIGRGCLADKYTNPKQFPQWHGTRQRILYQFPDNVELWDKYIYQRKKNEANATEFYKANRKQMDQGAVVSNRLNFVKPDEISAIQHVYNLIADMGNENFNCEFQNEPPEDMGMGETMPEERITEKLSGVDRGIVPAGMEKITAFVDVHDQKLFWSIAAWKQGMNGSVIDYGVDPVHSPIAGSITKAEKEKAVDLAIYDALKEFRQRAAEKYKPSLALVDSGYRQAAVFRFCRESVGWMASKGGSGKSGSYTTPKPDKMIPVIGQGYHVTILPQFRQRLVVFDPDRFKKLVHEGFLLNDVSADGSLSLFGDEPTIHRAFSEHIAAEQWDAVKMRFVTIPGRNYNHWLDCMVGCMVAAAMSGIKLTGLPSKPAEKKAISPQKSYARREIGWLGGIDFKL
jgi:hypothetical protein